jgi:hypothetical protein
MAEQMNELSIRQSAELQATKDAVREAQEVRAMITMARDMPRSEEAAYAALIRSCRRPSFATAALYKFPRGSKKDNDGNWVKNNVEGPSVGLAREFARCWGNLQYGFGIVRDDDNSRTVRGFAWDMETNTRKMQESTFEKLIQRKQGGQTVWIEPDERDLRELTNKHGAICERNCVLQLLPKDYLEDAMTECKSTVVNAAAKDPDAQIKAIVLGFSDLNVPVEQIEFLLGHPIGQSSPAEIADLRGIWKSIADGNSRWAEYVQNDAGAGQATGDENLKNKSNDRLAEAMARAAAVNQTTKTVPAENAEVTTMPANTIPAVPPISEEEAALKLQQERANRGITDRPSQGIPQAAAEVKGVPGLFPPQSGSETRPQEPSGRGSKKR